MVDKWKEYVEEQALETDDAEKIESLYTELSYLSEHPFDINKSTAVDWHRLPFLSDYQIEGILAYRERYDKLVSIYELKHIPELDMTTIDLLLPFVYIGENNVDKLPVSVDNLLKRGDNELQIRYDQGFQHKKGYQPIADSSFRENPNQRYLGESFYHYIRYAYSFNDRLQIGFTGEKDAGEPFANTYHKGYDYYSGYVFLKDYKRLKSLVVGDYKVSFGQGLVVSQDFTPGRNALIAQAERRNNGFRRHYSTNEHDYFRGLAATFSFRSVAFSFFTSYRKMDAAVDSNRFASLKTDGYHRLMRDREKQKTVPMLVFGGNIRYASPSLCIGVTALTYSFGQYQWIPQAKPYQLFHFHGNRNINASMDYLWKISRLKLYGEAAISSNGAIATLNALEVHPTSYISFLLLNRYYDRRYQAYFGNAFTQQSAVENEQGTYIGLQLTPIPYWKFSAYADVFRFPWLKYGVDAPSSGKEYMGQIDYACLHNATVYLRYTHRKKEKNLLLPTSKTVSIEPYSQHRFRLQASYLLYSSFTCRTAVDAVAYLINGKQSNGYMIAQSISLNPASLPIQLSVYGAWFRTDDYSSRVYSHEKNILYAFSMPSFYGRGMRLALTVQYKFSNCLSLAVKAADTYYADRDKIGSGLEEIEGSHKTDIYTFLKWKF